MTKPFTLTAYTVLTTFLRGITYLLITSQVTMADDINNSSWDVNNPPGQAYDANIDVREGTWMNVDVSPDGKTLVFDLLGDLYLLPIEGGEARALTTSIAWEMQPRFSPDGEWLAFTSDAAGGDNIWVMKRDGSAARQITNEDFRLLNSPAWSPDGNYIAARKHFTSSRSLGAGEIWLYHVAGGKGLQLNERPNEQKDLGEPAFTSDGSKILFSRDSTPGKTFEYSKDSNNIIYEIFSIDRANGNIEPLVSGTGGSVRPTPSPDGKTLAFVRRIRNQSSIFLKDLTTGEEYPIYQNLDRDMQETWAIHGVYPTIAWTPDSRDLVFWAGGKILRLNTRTGKVSGIPFHVKTEKSMRRAVKFPVDPAPKTFTTRMLRWVQVRPDGRQVVFQALGHLYVRNLPNGKAKRLTRDSEFEFYPAYSADGKRVVFVSWDDQDQGEVRTVSSRGGRSRTITRQPGEYLAPRFSPDGQQVVFQKVSGGYLTSPRYGMQPGVYRVDSEGSQASLVTRDGSAPFFAADSQRIYVTRSRGSEESAKRVLVSVNLQGNDAREHAITEFGQEFSLSPDERTLAFSERYQVYVTPFTHAARAIELGPKSDNLPIKRVSTNGGEFLSWSGRGKLHWSLGDTLYSATLPNGADWQEDAKAIPVSERSLGFEVLSDVPEGRLALTNARIITMEGDRVIEQGDLLIEGARIAALGESGKVAIADDTRRIDLSGKTVIPGLVDVHWHGAQAVNELTPQQNWVNYAALAFGVTTLHDPSNDTSEIFAASELAKSGAIVAPRIFSTGTILYGARESITAKIDSLEDAEQHLKRLQAQGAFSVKSYNQPRREQRQQILEAARRNGIMVVPEGGSLLQHNLTMIVDGHTGIEHAIPAAAIYNDVKQLWSQSQTGYTPTMVVGYGGIWGENYWYQHSKVWKHPLLSRFVPRHVLWPRSIRRTMAPEEDYNHFNIARVAKQLQDLGVGVQLGAHGQREGLGAHWEMWMFAQGGMTPLQVLRAATLDGARYLGMEDHIGSLKAGKLADLVILNANPLKNIRHSDQVDKVMVNGRLYNAATMNEIGLRQKPRKPFYFE